jgi:inosine-uridine nucleoside N-ribohydrolase
MVRVWVDTDIGDNPDDAIALLVAAAHPGVDLVGISTVRGDVVMRAQMARDLLMSVGAAVPLVYAGPPDPRALASAEVILAIGPQTNLAALLRAGVTLPPAVVMGGVFEPTMHRGESRDRESNVTSDPLAAAVVIANADDLLLVPLDVTAEMVVGPEAVQQFATVPRLGDFIIAWQSKGLALCLHDPLATLAMVGEHVQIGRRAVAITVDGRSIVDARDGTEHDVVLRANHTAAKRRIIDLVMTWGD